MFRSEYFRVIASGIGAALMIAAAGPAVAHETDIHHWFEHQRSLTDGGSVGLSDGPDAPAPAANGNGARVGKRPVEKPSAAAQLECFEEKLRMTDGYVPSGRCPAVHGDQRWIVDEDKQSGRPVGSAGRMP